ncbi:MAG: protein TolQ [Pseudomonadota bacterium]|nr:protein TolQ [Pseudomonadota bacterium]
MQVDMSFYRLVTEASVVVQIVMALLVIVSVVSWTMIFSKWRMLREARDIAGEFEERFWSGVDLGKMYERIRGASELFGMQHIFAAGFKEFVRLHRQEGASATTLVESSHRSMRVALQREVDSLDAYLSFLATVGSTSPYIGLFGTVWGIMNSFRALADMQQATLATVAPGIAEALIATALGLFAAIPAVIAYNRFSTDVDRLANQYEIFMEEFTALLQRQVLHRDATPEQTG